MAEGFVLVYGGAYAGIQVHYNEELKSGILNTTTYSVTHPRGWKCVIITGVFLRDPISRPIVAFPSMIPSGNLSVYIHAYLIRNNVEYVRENVILLSASTLLMANADCNCVYSYFA